MNTVVMPKLGDTMEEGKILNWLVKEGDKVEKGDSLAEIETEKVTIPVEAFAAGILRKIVAPAGTVVPVGEPIALTGTADEPLPAEVAGQAHAEAAQEATAGQGNPAQLTHAAAQAGAAPEAVLPPAAQPLASSAQPATTTAATAPANVSNGRAAERATQTATTAHGGRVFGSPIARRIAAEHGLDIATIEGTGPGGRVIREDVEAALARQQAAAQPVATPAPAAPVPAAAAPTAPGAAPAQEVRAVPLSMMRKTIAKRLQQSAQAVPHFYETTAIDATALGALREQINAYAQTLPQPIKISLNDLIVRGVALAIAAMPEVNVSFNGDELLFKRHINIGVAVALEQGLIVPVIFDANQRGVLDIAREARRLAEAARTNKLKPEEFQGGTFSVSNLGMFGIEEFTAIINPPEAAILAVGAAVPTPVAHEGQIVVREMMKVTLSVDHRALDGAQAARWLQVLKNLLEQPMGLLL